MGVWRATPPGDPGGAGELRGSRLETIFSRFASGWASRITRVSSAALRIVARAARHTHNFTGVKSPGLFANALVMAILLLAPSVARGQDHWTGVGAIGTTAMYMDTTTIVRQGALRKVWIKSVDAAPSTVVVAGDTVTFDAVAGLNVLDCTSRTYTVTSVLYFYGDEMTYSVPVAGGTGRRISSRTFLDAVYADVCRHR